MTAAYAAAIPRATEPAMVRPEHDDDEQNCQQRPLASSRFSSQKRKGLTPRPAAGPERPGPDANRHAFHFTRVDPCRCLSL